MDKKEIKGLSDMTKKALREMIDNGEISEESCSALDTAMANMISLALDVNKVLGIITDADVTTIKRSRAFLMENPGKGRDDPYGMETASIMFAYLNNLSLLNDGTPEE